VARLLDDYRSRISKELAGKLGKKNSMAVPRLLKICINSGIGKGNTEPKMLDEAVENLAAITGQKAVVTKAKKSVANFNLRRGFRIGCRVTLRGKRMYEFFDRLVNVAMPRIRDFSGMPRTAFDGRGNYTMGLDDPLIFPEVNPDKVQFGKGMSVTIVTSAKKNAEAEALLEAMGFPFKRD